MSFKQQNMEPRIPEGAITAADVKQLAELLGKHGELVNDCCAQIANDYEYGNKKRVELIDSVRFRISRIEELEPEIEVISNKMKAQVAYMIDKQRILERLTIYARGLIKEGERILETIASKNK
jgi:hypothetical protein